MNNENGKYNKNINEKKILGLRLSLKNNIKKEIIENNKLNLKKFYYKYEKVLTIFVVTLILLLGIYGFDFIENPRYIKFNYYVANYHTIDRCLRFSNKYSNFLKKDTKVSWFFRNSLMKQYIQIKNSCDSNFYNSVGLFYSLINDFKFLYSFYEKNKFSSLEEEKRYIEYKNLFLVEMHKILMEYRERNKTIKNFIYLGHSKEQLMYMIPNRISFYPEIAAIYFAIVYKEMNINEKTFNDLMYIYETFDIVYNEEKEFNSINFKTFNSVRFYKKQFSTYYPYFVLDYAQNIIALASLLYPEMNVCNISSVCENYKKVSSKKVSLNTKL